MFSYPTSATGKSGRIISWRSASNTGFEWAAPKAGNLVNTFYYPVAHKNFNNGRAISNLIIFLIYNFF